MPDPGATVYFIPGETCPKCGGVVASDGKTIWCYGQCGWGE
jgi:ribosomal protein S27AE